MKKWKAVVAAFTIPVLGCQDEAKPGFPAVAVAINDTSRLAISDSIYFIVSDTLPNKVTIVSEVAYADLHFSVNNGTFTKQPNEPVTLQWQNKMFQFYLSKSGFRDSETKTIMLQKQSERYLSKIDLSASGSSIDIRMHDKSRGILKIEVLNVLGHRLLQRTHLKASDDFTAKYALTEYPEGVYIISLTYGESQKAFRLLLQ